MQPATFKKIVRKYKNLVYSQALYSTGNRHDAADITQDVLIKLWNNMDTVQSQSMKSWLFTVTRNHCIDLSRKKRERYFSELNADEEESAFLQIPDAGASDPERSLERAEEQNRIVGAITRLPEKIRTAMILRYIQDEPYNLIAKTIGCPLNSVKVYLHRGRKMLAQALQKRMHE